MTWSLYLAGEIHSNWRGELAAAVKQAGLAVELLGPVTDHDASDNCGRMLSEEDTTGYWQDVRSASLNSLRTKVMLKRADVVIVRFSDQYRQWNAAFEAGQATAMDKPLIVVHPPELQHALKEIDAAAVAVAHDLEQVIDILCYVQRREGWQ